MVIVLNQQIENKYSIGQYLFIDRTNNVYI